MPIRQRNTTKPTNDHLTPTSSFAMMMMEEKPLSPSSACRENAVTIRSLSTHQSHKRRPKNAKTNQFIMISCIYAKLLVVTGTALIVSELITGNIAAFYFEAFFTYLYVVSIIFLLYVYFYLLKQKSHGLRRGLDSGLELGDDDPVPGSNGLSQYSTVNRRMLRTSENSKSHGSFFLRVGAIGFGLGTIIYNGLEFGAFLETPVDSPCYRILSGVNPILQIAFTFTQMYFIFRNARLNIHKFKVVARFGLMHVIATNLCIWIKTLAHESVEEIFENNILTGDGPVIQELIRHDYTTTVDVHNMTDKCQHQNIMGDIEEASELYIYPFIIEYSLIGAAVLFVMWKHVGPAAEFSVTFVPENSNTLTSSQAPEDVISQRPEVHFKVDCVGTSKGLFMGLFVLVGIIIAIILFFVLLDHSKYGFLAVYIGDLSHLAVLVLSIIAITVGFIRVRSMHFNLDKNEELSDILLGVSSMGIYLYATLSLISACHFSFTKPQLLTLSVNCLTIIQVTLQSSFMSDMSKRTLAYSHLSLNAKQKPGRQITTFLLICNLTFWIVYTFEMQSMHSTPTQLEYFGVLAWAVIIRICQPLAIFYRFHSAVMLAEIWKNAYKNVVEI